MFWRKTRKVDNEEIERRRQKSSQAVQEVKKAASSLQIAIDQMIQTNEERHVRPD
ncbi:hypothetical protein [Pseudooceanicola sp.]|uniref:hypothetical protein n=1 Tax=Pseudooceanicola sp. TaxID=1914328 RepID=UPI0035117CDC